MSRLDGPRAKLERALEHLGALKKESARFRGDLRYGNQYNTASEFDPTTRKFSLKLHVLKEPPLMRYRVLAGDVVHQLRSALDNLVEQATIAYSGEPLSTTEFPVFSDRTAYQRRNRKGEPVKGSGHYAVRGIHPDLQSLVEKLQPFHASTSGQPRPLAVLHDLWNSDKHRVPPVIASATLANYQKINVAGVPGTPERPGSRDIYLMMMFPFEEGVNLVELELLPGESERLIRGNLKVKLTLDLEFGEGPLSPQQTGRRYPVVESLELLAKFVESALGDFAPYLN